MKTTTILAGITLCLLPLVANAAPTHHAMKAPAKMAATMYQCQKCHMKVSAAMAKKDHYKDPMDGGKLVPVMGGTKKPAAAKPMGGMSM